MKLRTILTALLLVGALAGLIAAPFAQSSIAASASSSIPSSVKMADGMPCCPDEAPAKDCHKSCPLMAMCANQTLLNNAEYYVGVSMQVIAVSWPPSDLALDGITSLPPPRPPRSIV